MEEGTGAEGARRRNAAQEAIPELKHERVPGQGGLSRHRRHLCTCLEGEASSGDCQVSSVWLALGPDMVMIQGTIWTLFSRDWGAWKDFKLGSDRIRFAFQKDASGACKGVDLEGTRLEAGDQSSLLL